MCAKLEEDSIFLQIRDKLQKDSIKLWLEPYYKQEDGPCADTLKSLAEDFSKTLNIPADICLKVFHQLQGNALEKLRQRELNQSLGIATLRIKVLNHKTPPSLLSTEIALSSLALDLKNVIAEKTNIPAEKIKLISSGKVLCDKEVLRNQGLQHGNQVLALTIDESSTDLRETENRIQEIEGVKADTRLLASDDASYVELEDQQGNPIQIPEKEKRALMVAMALHEKGRSALKKEDYAKALVFFLDADHEFSQCNSALLNSVDNYALLDLDIVWCYLCLQSVSYLPEAYQRLKRCEQMFEKSYGTNLERLIALKGTPGNEAALLMRLHLLQGIVLFHQNKHKEALVLLQRVQTEMQMLKVDENSLMQLIELGYSVAEARLGLRATNGDLNRAASYIDENREKRSESRKQALKEQLLKKEQKKLGKCMDGTQFVNPSFVNMLVNMGYNKENARVALQRCNNDISASVQYIQEHPCPSSSRSQEVLGLINELIPNLVAAGFDPRMAQFALSMHNGDMMKAVEELLTRGGFSEAELEGLGTLDKEEKEKKAKMKEAYLRLSEDISMVDDDHLDLTLEKEEEFLQQYLSMLENY